MFSLFFSFLLVQIFPNSQVRQVVPTGSQFCISNLHLWWSCCTMFHEKGKPGVSGFQRIPGESRFMCRCQRHVINGKHNRKKALLLNRQCHESALPNTNLLWHTTLPFTVYPFQDIGNHLWSGESSVLGSMCNTLGDNFCRFWICMMWQGKFTCRAAACQWGDKQKKKESGKIE